MSSLVFHLFHLNLKFTREIRNNIDYILGAYIPLTKEGNILVDDVLASCYASTHHDLAHIGMTPIRLFPSIIRWIFGKDDGPIVYTKLVGEFGKIVAPFAMVYELN